MRLGIQYLHYIYDFYTHISFSCSLPVLDKVSEAEQQKL